MMAVLALADGTSIVQDGVFESRFLHVNELQKMGARIDVQGGAAVITGVPNLRGADVRATDLRAGAALILAGLAASEETAVFQIQHINRGYENIVSKLRSLGAAIDLDSSEEEDLA
jgi:UDP-N-acetylglucosamine 1-carboxyvinyltransferase